MHPLQRFGGQGVLRFTCPTMGVGPIAVLGRPEGLFVESLIMR